jgi:DNA topoisomerase I
MHRRDQSIVGTNPGADLKPLPNAAAMAGLQYVKDSARGIRREKKGRSFRYLGPDDKSIRDRKTLARIGELAIPPA